MKIRVFSDIHLEFGDYVIPPLDGDKDTVLVLAGDITVASNFDLMTRVFDPFMQRASKQFAYVIMIAGNHEHYNGNFHLTHQLLEQVTSKYANVRLLDNSLVVIDGVAFLGATLWTDCGSQADLDPMANMHWKGMNDHECISYMEFSSFPVSCVREEHLRSVKFIKKELVECKTLGARKTVLVTHHAPSKQSILPIYATHSLNKFFASDLVLDLVDAGVDLCIHGHMHNAFRYKLASGISEAEVVCNPRGYHGYESKPETRGFNDKLVLEI